MEKITISEIYEFTKELDLCNLQQLNEIHEQLIHNLKISLDIFENMKTIFKLPYCDEEIEFIENQYITINNLKKLCDCCFLAKKKLLEKKQKSNLAFEFMMTFSGDLRSLANTDYYKLNR